MAKTVQTGKCLDNIRSKPSPILFIAPLGFRTAVDDAFKVLIDSHFISLLPQELSHGVADMNLFRDDDITVERTIPMRLTLHLKGIPGEKAVTIGQYQTLDRQVTANGYQTVFLTPAWIGEP